MTDELCVRCCGNMDVTCMLLYPRSFNEQNQDKPGFAVHTEDCKENVKKRMEQQLLGAICLMTTCEHVFFYGEIPAVCTQWSQSCTPSRSGKIAKELFGKVSEQLQRLQYAGGQQLPTAFFASTFAQRNVCALLASLLLSTSIRLYI